MLNAIWEYLYTYRIDRNEYQDCQLYSLDVDRYGLFTDQGNGFLVCELNTNELIFLLINGKLESHGIKRQKKLY